MAVIEVEVEVSCTCGNPLSATATGDKIETEACEKCVGVAYEEGFDQGRTEGYTQCEKDNEL